VQEVFGPYGEVITTETFTCGHCQHIIAVPVGQMELRHPCYGCQRLICGPCRNKNVCFPAEKLMELEEYVGRLVGDSCHEDVIARNLETDRRLREMGIIT
jgi:hypothetical protein